MYKISGTIKNIDDQPLSRIVQALDRTSLSVIFQTTSNPLTGEYTLYLQNNTPVAVRAIPESGDAANWYFYDNITPEQITTPAPTTGNNDIGIPGTLGFGVGTAPELLIGMSELPGTQDISSDEYGNYIFDSDGSIMVWIPAFWYKWGTGSNGVDLNQVDIKAFNYFEDETEANASGYAIHRAFYDGGTIKEGVFVDKYMCSKHPTNTIPSSLKYGNPLNSAAGNSASFSTLGLTNRLWAAVDASKLRGTEFFCTSRFIYSAIAMLSYAHGMAATTTEFCGWYGVTNNYPKGVTITSGTDTQDATIQSYAGEYSYQRKSGSVYPLNKNTHNGQDSGVFDIKGNLYEVSPGISYESSQFRVLKASVAMKTVTGGTTLATDLWGATGVAALYDDASNTFGALEAQNAWRYFDNSVQVFSEDVNGLNWQLTGIGAPLAGALKVANDNIYSGGIHSSRTNLCCALTGGSWADGASAGLYCLYLYYARTNSVNSIGFRLSAYVP